MRINAGLWGKKLKERVVEYMTRPRMVIGARSFYSRADMKLYLKKRLAMTVFLVIIDLYVGAVVIVQTIPMVSHALASENIVVISDPKKSSDLPSEDTNRMGSHDGSVSAVPNIESEEGSAHAQEVVITLPSEDSITDCDSAADVYSVKYGVSRDLLGRMIDAESGNKPTAANPKSTARGCFQFIIGTWELYGKRHWGEEFYSKNIYNPSHNVELAVWAISQYGTSDWDASRHIWGK